MGNSESHESTSNHLQIPSNFQPRHNSLKAFASTEIPSSIPITIKKSKKPRVKHNSRNISTDLNIDLDAPTAKLQSKSKTQEDRSLLRTALKRHFILSGLPDENIDKVAEEMKLFCLKSKEVVFYQGNPGYKFFIVSKGTLEILVNDEVKGHLTTGQGFGERALIHDMRRSATIRTVTKVELWGITRQVFRDTLKVLNSLHFEENKKFLKTVPFLQVLTETQINSLSSVVVCQSFSHGQQIVVEGDTGGSFFIIKEGCVECSVKGSVIRCLSKGEFFGEQALLYKTNRTATITAVNKVVVLSLGPDLLKSTVGERLQTFLYKNTLRIAFDSSKFLAELPREDKEKIIEKVEIFLFTKGEVAVPKGVVKGRYLWIVLKGSISAGTKQISKFQDLGAKWIWSKSQGEVKENLIADENTDLGIIRADLIHSIISGPLAEVVKITKIFSILKNVHIFRMLSSSKLRSLSQKVTEKEFKQGEGIFNQGENGEGFYIIKEGEVDIIKDEKVIRTVFANNYFGERSIILNETRTATAKSRTDSVLWMLSREDFLSIVDENILALLVKRIQLQDDTIGMEDLYIVDQLGKGTFGSVYLCVKQQNKVLYALKSISRKKIDAYNLHESLQQEKKVLSRVEHQFIVKFVKTFKDQKRLFFLLEFIQGMNLLEVLRVLNILNGSRAKFYASCLLLILEQLHENFIIFRDLKPENVMVEDDGYLKLLDFGTAKIIESRTFTVIGTPHYMAPEVIMGKGYSFAADLWSLGVVIFEMVSGTVPFGDNFQDNPFAVYREIINGKYEFPHFVHDSCKGIVEDLLKPFGEMRGNVEGFKRHPWFEGVSWDDLLSRKKSPPYKPRCDDLTKVIDVAIEQGRTVEAFLNRNTENSGLIQFFGEKKAFDKNWDRDF
jgi:cGMP-dependent protein kinase